MSLAMFAVGWGANQFAPMLLVYHRQLHTSGSLLAALFGVYALGLVPGLLLGGAASDRRGRRPLARIFVALSPVATLVLVLGGHSPWGLALGRLLAGACSGVVFGAGSAWLQELSEHHGSGIGARRATVSLSAGFGAGPLVAALLAQWAPHPLWLPYLPHVALGMVALLVVWNARETVIAGDTPRPMWRVPRAVRSVRFIRVVAPLAPWVFGFASFAGVILPAQLHHVGGRAVLFAGLANAVTLGTGALVQPLAKGWERRRRLSAAIAGLGLGLLGLALAVAPIALDSPSLVLVAAVAFGAAYGAIMVSGLRETERLAAADERGATVAVFLALTYVGFAMPLLVAALAQALSQFVTLAVVAAAALASALAVRSGLGTGDATKVRSANP